MTLNVLWIMTDQHRADALGCMGNAAIKTPNLDRLAASGVLFGNAFCQSPVCMASRGSMFTGRYPEAIRVRGMGVLPPSEITLPQALRRAGYRTGAFGKVHFTPQQYTMNVLKTQHPSLNWRDFGDECAMVPPVDDPSASNYGFEEYVGDEDALHGPFNDWLAREAPELLNAQPQRFEGPPNDLFVSPYPASHHPTTFVANHAIDFIQRQSTQPWMTLCSFVSPHHPFQAPAEIIDRYPLDDVPLLPRRGGVSMRDIPAELQGAVNEFDGFREDVQRRIVQHYYASISLIDDQVGRLLDTLEATGQLERTIVLFTADHGEFIGSHSLIRKPSFHYDDVVRIPLMMRGPGIAPRREDGLVELIDLMPTLLDLVGQPIPIGVQGMSWANALKTRDAIGRPDVYSDMHHMDPMTRMKAGGPYTTCYTLRTPDWKLNIYPREPKPTGQLFHLAHDPDETADLFHEASSKAKREEMMWRLQQRVYRNIDPLPLKLTQW